MPDPLHSGPGGAGVPASCKLFEFLPGMRLGKPQECGNNLSEPSPKNALRRNHQNVHIKNYSKKSDNGVAVFFWIREGLDRADAGAHGRAPR